jgi:RNA polymerase sigma factor (sigma-70 family)
LAAGWQALGDAALGRLRRRRNGPRTLTLRGDAELVRQAQSGDRDAFEELVRRHADRLYAVVLRVCGDPHEAEDVTQEAFLRAWRGLGGFEGRSQFFTWLYRIGINEAKRRVERVGSVVRSTSLDDASVEVPDYADSPERRAQQRDLRRALEDSIMALPLDYRMPLVLRDVEGLSTAQAAEIMGLGEAAFKSRLHRARLSVRAAVEDYVVQEDDR